ncbi:unnamed protein product [Closterium sp. NIES-53]
MSGSPRSNNGSSVTSPSRPTASPAADNSYMQQQHQQQQYQQQPMYGMPLSNQPVHTTAAAASLTAAVATAASAATTAAAAVTGSSSQPGQQSSFVPTGPYQYQARARGARVRVELEVAVAVAAVAAEGVGVAAGLVAEVVVVVAAAAETVVVEAAEEVEAVEAAAEEAVVVEAVELVGVVTSSVAAVVVASAHSGSSSSARGTSLRLSSFVSGTLGVRGVEVLVPAPTFFVLATARFPGASEIPHWDDLLRAGVAIFDLDFDAILAAMYAVTYSEETEGYRCFQPDPGIGPAAPGACASAALGACETALSGTASSSSSLTFTLDSGASRSFFRDRTTLTPLGRPVAVSLADPSGGPVLSHFSTVLPCPAAPSGTLSGLYLPSFSTNLVSGAALQDVGVHQFTPASQRVTHCTDARTGRHLATFSRQPGSSLYTLTVESPPVPASGPVAASGQVLAAVSRSGPESAPCSCRLLSHETLLWHHRLGHPSLPRLWSMASRVLVSGLPQSLPPLPSGPGPSCVPCVEGRLRATPHSSHFPPTEAPLQTLHMDVWGPAPVRGQGYERYFLLVVDDYSRYTTVLPLRSKGAVTEGATAEGAEPGGTEPGGAVPGDAGSGGAGSGAAEPGVSPPTTSRREPLSPQELREWFARRWRRATESGGAAGAGAGASSTVEGEGAAGPGAAGPAGPHGAGAAEGVGAEPTAVGPPAGGVGGAGAVAEGAGAVPAESGAAARPRPYFVPLLQQVLGLSPPVESPQPVQSQSLQEPSSPLPAPSPYTGPTGGLAERREPASRPASPVRAARAGGRSSRQRPPPVPGTHRMSLRPSTAALRAPLPSPPESSLPALADPESASLRAASPAVPRLLATVVTDPSFESAAASALVAELVDFAARCRLDYAAGLVAESASVCPPSVGGGCALGTDVLEDRQEELQCLAAASPHLASVLLAPEGDPDALDIPTPRSYAEAVEGPYSSQWQAAMDAEMASWKSTGTYVDEVPPPGANIVSGMWIFKVKRPPGSPPVFKARYVARGFSQRQGVDYFQTFSPTPKMTTLRVLLHIAAQRDYELHSLDFSTAFLQGSLHEEIWLRRPPGFTGTFPPGTQWSLRRPVYGLRQAPREWHDTLRTTLAALGFAPSTADPSRCPVVIFLVWVLGVRIRSHTAR